MSKFHSSSRRKLNVCSSGRHSPPLAPSHPCGLAYRPWLLSSTQFGGKDKLCLSHLCLGSFRCSGGDKLYALLRGSLIVFTRLGHFAVLPQNSAESLGFSAFQPWLLVRITWGGGLLKKHQCPTLVPVKSECVGHSGSTSVISQAPRDSDVGTSAPGQPQGPPPLSFSRPEMPKLSGSTWSRKMSFS